MNAIDLGLTVNWGECNLGADEPKEIGNYYAWGEVELKDYYDDNTYKYFNGQFTKITKYNNDLQFGNNGYLDKLISLEKTDDAVIHALGNKWRMPTTNEVWELLHYTKQEYIKNINCVKFTSRINSNSILIPISGLKIGNNICKLGEDGGIWTSDLCLEYSPAGDKLELSDIGFFMHDCIRSYGLPIRPIQEKEL